MTRRDVATILWLAGLLILLVGVVIHLIGQRPYDRDLILLGFMTLILSRLGSLTKR